MSIDNGIYIGSFDNGKEYRVIEATAIGNVYYNAIPFEDVAYEKGNPKEVVNYFGAAKAFSDKCEAQRAAMDKLDEIMNSELPMLEYGVSMLTFPFPFEWYADKATRQPKHPWET